ncbi:MAG: response regulator transcription factor [Chloroflexi bacterium]|nr:response regulator transcription factor [Chloroflexota bacterium]MBI3168805.1 response regulator transcription factor [Chloroflexota bacterium]
MKPIRVLIVDDHEIVREGLQILLSEESEFEVIGTAGNSDEAVSMTKLHKPDVVLMDVVLPGLDGIETTKQVVAVSPSTQVLVLTSYSDDQRVRDAIQAGAIGYLLKDVLKAELLNAIRSAAAGKPALHAEAQQFLMRHLTGTDTSPHSRLTSREFNILQLIAKGKSNKEIALALHLTEGTVKGYVSTVFDKLGVADRTQAALYAVEHGLAPK